MSSSLDAQANLQSNMMPRSELLFTFEEGLFERSEAKLSLTDVFYLLRLGAYENEQCKLLG